MASTVSQSQRASFTHASLWRAGLIAAIISSVGNGIVYGIGRAADTIPQSVMVDTPTGEDPITFAPVIMFSILPVIIATLLYAVLLRSTQRPARMFWIIGTVVLVASFISPLTIPDAPAKMIVTLNLMHVVTALAAMGTITRLVPRQRDPSPPTAPS